MRVLIKKILPLNYAEDKDWRVLQAGHGKTKFSALGIERVKHIIVEMYEATK